MKALSVREPWATLIRDGVKSIETRSWRTDFRGDLCLCACKKPAGLLSGMAFAVVEVVDVRPMVKEDEGAACCCLYPGAFSWVLRNVRKIELKPVVGKQGFFEVEL